MFPSEITYHKFNNFKSILWLLGGAVQNICPFYMWEGLPFRPQSFGISKKMCKIWTQSGIEPRSPAWQTNALTTRPPRISYKWGTFVDIYQNFQEKIANFQYKLGSTAILFYKQGFKNKRLPISCARVRHVSPTPADLGGVRGHSTTT